MAENLKQQMKRIKKQKGQNSNSKAKRGWEGLTDSEFKKLSAIPRGERTEAQRRLIRKEQMRRNNITLRKRMAAGKVKHTLVYNGVPTAYAEAHKPLLAKAKKLLREREKNGIKPRPTKDYLPVPAGKKQGKALKKAAAQRRYTNLKRQATKEANRKKAALTKKDMATVRQKLGRMIGKVVQQKPAKKKVAPQPLVEHPPSRLAKRKVSEAFGEQAQLPLPVQNAAETVA